MVLAAAAHAVTISDVTVTTTTGTYTSPLGYGNYSGEGFFFIPGITDPTGDGIEIESVDDIIGQGGYSVVSFSYYVTADPGEKIYGAQVTPGLYVYDATGEISIDSSGVQNDALFSDNGSGWGTTAPNYGISLGAGYTSLFVTGSYVLDTLDSQNAFAEGYADHLEITYSENSTPGPESIVPFGLGLAGALCRRRRKQK